MFKKYIEYLKDNPENLWFKRKLYGWGWVPVKWQGFVVVLTAVAFIVWSALDLTGVNGKPTNNMLTWYFIKLIVCIVVLLFICYKKGEKPRWQWGIPKE